jgi:hypothetical protein
MLYYKKYLVKDNEGFNAENYPRLLSDLIQINEETAHIQPDFKADILISFAKKHSLKNEWIIANPEFTRLITSGELPVSTLESLFDSSSKNLFFQQQLEHYLTSTFTGVKPFPEKILNDTTK